MGHQKMRKQNGLGMLHVRHASHRDFQICFGLEQKAINQSKQCFADFRRRIHDEQPKIRGDEFVAAAAGVQFSPERPELFDQRVLYELMDILRRRGIQPVLVG